MDADRWRRIQALFHEAEPLEGGERGAYLAVACAGDETLRRQVETLLACDGSSSGLAFTAGLADQPAAGPEGFPNYRILRKLGEGGMGVVYEAEQQNPRRLVALKVIRAGRFASGRMRRMFQREVEMLGRLEHPGIATIYESGAGADGQPFLAMELVKGAPLDAWLARQPALATLAKNDAAGRLRLFRAICDAVAYAHQNAVIHRDIKPSNILVPDAGEGSTGGSLSTRPPAKILDFGLARITGQDAEATMLTETGMVQGSIQYMSPEQARGDNARIDVRTDVYSLGVVLYVMLTGHHPYFEPDGSLVEALARITTAAPRPFRQWLRRYDEDLETIAMKALEKEPERRYPSVAAFAADIDRYEADLPVVARPPSRAYQLRKLVQRHRAAFALLAASAVLAVAFVAALIVESHRVRAERDRAAQEAATARQVSEFLVDLFRRANPQDAHGVLTAADLLRTGKERLEKELHDQPELRARLLDNIGSAYNVLGPPEEAEKAYFESIQVRQKTFGADTLASSESWSGLSDTYYNVGRYDESVRAGRRALAIREKRLKPGDPAIAAALGAIATALAQQGKLAEAEDTMSRAVAIDRSGHASSVDAANRLESYGMVLQKSGKLREAIPVLREAVRRETAGLGELDTAPVLNELGIALNLAGHPREGEQALRHSLAIARKVFGDDQPNVAVIEGNLADSLCDEGRYTEAEALARNALRVFTKAMGIGHPQLVFLDWALGHALDGEGRFREAGVEFESALALDRKVRGADDAHTLDAAIELGEHDERAGDAKASLAVLEPGLSALERAGKKDSREYAVAERSLGEAYVELGRASEARTALRHSAATLLALLGADSTETQRSARALESAPREPGARHKSGTQATLGSAR